jgi:hypothetical protein
MTRCAMTRDAPHCAEGADRARRCTGGTHLAPRLSPAELAATAALPLVARQEVSSRPPLPSPPPTRLCTKRRKRFRGSMAGRLRDDSTWERRAARMAHAFTPRSPNVTARLSSLSAIRNDACPRVRRRSPRAACTAGGNGYAAAPLAWVRKRAVARRAPLLLARTEARRRDDAVRRGMEVNTRARPGAAAARFNMNAQPAHALVLAQRLQLTSSCDSDSRLPWASVQRALLDDLLAQLRVGLVARDSGGDALGQALHRQLAQAHVHQPAHPPQRCAS